MPVREYHTIKRLARARGMTLAGAAREALRQWVEQQGAHDQREPEIEQEAECYGPYVIG